MSRNLPDLGGKITEFGKTARDLLAAGLSNKQIIDELVKRYPEAPFNVPSLRQYTANLRYTQKRKAGLVQGEPSSQGEVVPTETHGLPLPPPSSSAQ